MDIYRSKPLESTRRHIPEYRNIIHQHHGTSDLKTEIRVIVVNVL